MALCQGQSSSTTARQREPLEEDHWILDVEEELQRSKPSWATDRWRNRCIYRVPEALRGLHKNAYDPQLASFGPYHHDKCQLKPMEPFKHRALFSFLTTTEKTLEDVARAMEKKVGRLRECYDELGKPWDDDQQFLKLMVLDGCFMWHIMEVAAGTSSMHLGDEDPVFGNDHLFAKLCLDMLRVENQLPLLVLFTLSKVAGYQKKDALRNVQCFINFLLQTNDETGKEMEKIVNLKCSTLHLLDAYRQFVLLDPQHDRAYMYSHSWNVLPATELHESGVNFAKSETNLLNDISFTDGALRLPQIQVDDHTEHKLMNLLMFEQLRAEYNDSVASYVTLMNDLVNATIDVSLLRKKGIIKGMLGSDAQVTSLFHSLATDIAIGATTARNIKSVDEKLKKYCRKRWPRLRAGFLQAYFRSPWVFFSVLGALVLLCLTILQTVFTMLSYYQS